MGMIDCASGKAIWRGIDYYQDGRVLEYKALGEGHLEGRVAGNGGNVYEVTVDTKHPRKCTCNCAFAAGRRVVCKHAMAVYFTAYPEVYQAFMDEVEEFEMEEERAQEQHEAEIRRYVCSLSKKELQEELIRMTLDMEELMKNRW